MFNSGLSQLAASHKIRFKDFGTESGILGFIEYLKERNQIRLKLIQDASFVPTLASQSDLWWVPDSAKGAQKTHSYSQQLTTGANTDVGKTLLTTALVLAESQRTKNNIFYLK